MARYIDLSDKAKGAVQRAAARKVDWDTELARIANEAAALKNAPARSEARRERQLDQLRRDYASTLRMKHFADTGENLAHRGLVD